MTKPRAITDEERAEVQRLWALVADWPEAAAVKAQAAAYTLWLGLHREDHPLAADAKQVLDLIRGLIVR